jgi:RNA chaperone Hfq
MTPMAAKSTSQDEYLNKAIAGRTAVRILLLSGKDLRGVIKATDQYTRTLDLGGGTELLVYKSAISVIGPPGRPAGE